jgi:hypothetical protein
VIWCQEEAEAKVLALASSSSPNFARWLPSINYKQSRLIKRVALPTTRCDSGRCPLKLKLPPSPFIWNKTNIKDNFRRPSSFSPKITSLLQESTSHYHRVTSSTSAVGNHLVHLSHTSPALALQLHISCELAATGSKCLSFHFSMST